MPINKEKKSFYVCCPNCSRRLCKAKENSDIEIECPKCNDVIRILVSCEKRISAEIVKERSEQLNNSQ